VVPDKGKCVFGGKSQPAAVDNSPCQTADGLAHIFGNVFEYVNPAKAGWGGSYYHSKAECDQGYTSTSEIDQQIGFRCCATGKINP
jgi:hypothetical protein